ncbi:MAG: histidine phosphatase family protein [Candidatus Diapherotrites archaeon]|nr:histidine phosphatase family protein [Candidatus Diapherotrites archaeon]
MATLVYLIRHAETDWNLEKRIQGQTNHSAVTKNGVKQAEATRDFFEQNPVDLVFSSPMTRAIDTAKIIFPGKRIFTDHRFVERGFGEFEGKTWDEIEKIRPGLHAIYLNDRSLSEVKDAELVDDAQKRSIEALQEIISVGFGKKIAIIAHGATIKLILLKILNKPFTYYKEIHQKNCAITLVEFSGKNLANSKILTENNINHLKTGSHDVESHEVVI